MKRHVQVVTKNSQSSYWGCLEGSFVSSVWSYNSTKRLWQRDWGSFLRDLSVSKLKLPGCREESYSI